jgi:preprotein translocase subunit SecF
VSDQPRRGLAWRLYHGETAFDFVGRRNRWFALSTVVILVGLVALGTRGLNFGIDFKGGTVWQVPAHGVTVANARSAVSGIVPDATVQTITAANVNDIRVESGVSAQQKRDDVTNALAKLTKTTPNGVNVTSVGATWGHDITRSAERALFFFLVAIFAFIWFRFSEWKMSVAALVALVHDLLVTVGVYAIFGFPVTPATVIAILTILGYSLYDTVVVFDKVDENTKGLAASGRMTYSDTVNLSMNQVLMRSINTSLVAILPILSVLLVGSVLFGATTLREFGLALFVGLVTGAYSSIFVAAPLLAILKEHEQRYATIRQRIESRGAAGALLTPAAAAAAIGASRPTSRRAARELEADELDAVADASELDDADLAAAGSPRSPASGTTRSSGVPSRPGSGRAVPPRARPNPNRQTPRGRKKGKRR